MKTKNEMIEELVNSKIKVSKSTNVEIGVKAKIVLEKLIELIEKYKTSDYLSSDIIYESNWIYNIYMIYTTEEKNLGTAIFKEYNNDFKEYYVERVYMWWNSTIGTNQKDIYEYRSQLFEKCHEYYMDDICIHAELEYEDLEIEDKVYFLLLLEEYEIKPTEELFKTFCNSQEAFKRDIKISKLLAA